MCSSETVVVPDGRLTVGTLGFGTTTTWFGASLRIGNSYSVELNGATGSSAPLGTLAVFSADDGCTGTSTLATRDTAGIDPQGSPGAVRMSFAATGVGTFFRMRLVSGAGSSYTFGLSDTTMYSPAWTTEGAFDTYYSFQNTTTSTLNATLTLLDGAGAVLSTLPLSIPPRQTASTNTASVGTIRNRTGTARFTHDGPPAAVVAEVAIANFAINPAYVQPVKFQAVRETRSQ